eukprot:NODE_59_length_28102_cov_0.971110.p6 type:complete len:501 gc:universal NODE_59_length_28102_cov_0.971110:12380-13882(+)
MFSTIYIWIALVSAQISSLGSLYSLGGEIQFSIINLQDVAKTTILLSNNEGPHPFTALIQKLDSKLTDISVTLPSKFAVGKGFYFTVIYEGTSTTTYKSSLFEIKGDGFAIGSASVTFNYPVRDVVVETDLVYDVSYDQNFLTNPIKLTATLVRADGIDIGIVDLNNDLDPKHLSFEWHVGTDLSTSKYYYIYLEADFGTSKAGSFSPQFTVNNPNDVASADGVNVKFLAPKSQSLLVVGSQFDVSWEYLVQPAKTINLKLLKSDSTEIKIAADIGTLDNVLDTDISGKISITVPTVAPGNFYQILLTGSIDGQFVFSELSQVFSITDPNDVNGLQFSLPQADDVYSVSQAYDVAFTFLGTKKPKHISFDLCKGSFDTFPIDQTISDDASSLSKFVSGETPALTFRVPIFTVQSIITLNYDTPPAQGFDSFTFEVPFFITTGKDYFIRAKITYSDNSEKESNSATFTVQGTAGTFILCRFKCCSSHTSKSRPNIGERLRL